MVGVDGPSSNMAGYLRAKRCYFDAGIRGARRPPSASSRPDRYLLARSMTSALFLLGAGASVEAGVPMAVPMLAAIQERLSGSPMYRDESRALRFVMGLLEARKAIQVPTGTIIAGRRLQPQLDVEEAFEAVEQLAQREDLPIGAFVGAWHAGVSALDAPMAQSFSSVASLERSLEHLVDKGTGRSGSSSSREVVKGILDLMEPSTKRVFASLRTAMLHALCHVVGLPQESNTGYLRPIVGSGSPIVTLNYDNVIELAAQGAGVPLQVYLPGVDEVPRQGALLLKLHGSADWVRARLKGAIPLQGVERTGVGGNGFGAGQPALIFGAGNKLIPDGPFQELLWTFRDVLERQASIVVVGYSWRDPHINEAIARWFNKDDSRSIRVIDPAGLPTAWQDPFANGLNAGAKKGRVEVIAEPAGRAIARLYP